MALRRHRRRIRETGRQKSPMPDVTPIVNVALVLLIIFMVVMPAIREGVIVNTPKAENTEQLNESIDNLILSIKEDGSLYIDLRRVEPHALKGELVLAYTGRENRPIIIKGAKNLPYSEILALMEICQGIGAPGVDLMAKKEE